MFLMDGYFLSISGFILIIICYWQMKLKLRNIISLWIGFWEYFLKDSTKIDKYYEKNPDFGISGFFFILGWFFLIAGILRLLSR